MFGRLTKKNVKPQAASAPVLRRDLNPSVIASNMSVLGNVVSDGVLDIDGKVDGNVSGHSITIRSNGRIRGDVMAEEVFVYGIVDGLIKATNVTLYEGAQVSGTIMHESLTVEDGASVDGKLKRTERMLLGELVASPPVVDEEELAAARAKGPAIDSTVPRLESLFDNDNDEPQSEAEIKILENLRLIS